MEPRTCENCRWWKRDGSGTMGQCRRFPPAYTSPARTDLRFFCGEHERHPPAAPAPATAPAPQPEPFRLREGMWARRRDGAVVGPVGLSTVDPERYPFAAEYAGHVYSYRENGSMLYARESDHDLVDEVPAPERAGNPASPTPAPLNPVGDRIICPVSGEDRAWALRFFNRSPAVEVRVGKHPAMTLYDLRPAEVAVIKERRRQERAEGYTAAHDDRHRNAELADAAAAYAMSGVRGVVHAVWPQSFGGTPRMAGAVPDRIRQLEKAAALCIAEIERLKRLP